MPLISTSAIQRIPSRDNTEKCERCCDRKRGIIQTIAQIESTGQFAVLTGAQHQQQPQACPCQAERPSFSRKGTAMSAARESTQGAWNSALIASPARVVRAR